MLDVALRMQAVQSPVIPIVGDWIRQNPGTISLGQGVVSYPPPAEAREAIDEFWKSPVNHRYQAVVGLPELVKRIEGKLQAENKITLDAGQSVVVTAGGNMAFMNAVLAIADPGDEIILQVPYYFNHEMAVTIAGCRPVLVATDSNYQLRPEAIAQAVTDRTRAVVTVSPNNPTGAVYSEAHLRMVNQLCLERGLYHIHDEAYEYFVYGRATHFSPASVPSARARTISLFSLSKAYGFASWRIGYMVAPAHLLEAIRKIQDTLLICPPVISQYAACGALRAGRAFCDPHIEALQQTRSLVLAALEEIGDLCEVPPAEGAFYVLLRLRSQTDSQVLAEWLVQKHKVAVIPGNAFGLGSGCHLRIAYGALEPATVAEGLGRLIGGLKELG